MIRAVLAPIFRYLPGGSLARKGDGWAELALLRVACALAVSTPILVVLALLGWFTIPVVAGYLVALAAIAWVVSPRERSRICPGRWDLAALVLVVGAFALYAHPAEYVLKDRDPGVYAVVAAKLARTGEILTRDPLVAAVAPFHEFEFGAKYPGFFVYGEDLLVPQFFPGAFVWPGLGNLFGGVWGGGYTWCPSSGLSRSGWR